MSCPACREDDHLDCYGVSGLDCECKICWPFGNDEDIEPAWAYDEELRRRYDRD